MLRLKREDLPLGPMRVPRLTVRHPHISQSNPRIGESAPLAQLPQQHHLLVGR